MPFLDKVEVVLQDAGQPLHYNEITRLLLTTGVWATGGKTPQATVNARIAEDIKHNPASRFVRNGKGIFTLRPASPLVPVSEPSTAAITLTRREPRNRNRGLSFLDAAAEVLERFGRRKPMHYKDITRLAIEHGLIATAGKTPEATLLAQIGTDVDRSERRGERPRFTRHGRGYIGLTRWTANGLAFQIAQHNDRVRQEMHKRIRSLSPSEFEQLARTLLISMGFEAVEVSGGSGDGGIDVRGVMVTGDVIRTRMAVQVKHWKKTVEPAVVREVRGSLGTHEQGLIITSSTFSKSARQEAERANATPVGLMDGEQLVTLLIEHEIGVRRRQENILELETEPDGEPSLE
jgi:restriction system protein